jgi:hypothetical protein
MGQIRGVKCCLVKNATLFCTYCDYEFEKYWLEVIVTGKGVNECQLLLGIRSFYELWNWSLFVIAFHNYST